MTINIGICDDCRGQIELIKGYMAQNQVECDYTVFSSIIPEQFLIKVMEIKPQLVLLDVDMEGMNGIELGERIKCFNEDTVILYITGHEQYAVDAFGVRAFHYLIKPVTQKKFEKVFKEAVQFIIQLNQSKCDQRAFTVKIKNGSECIPYQDILCFEKEGHKIRIHTVTGIKEYYGRIIDLISTLDEDVFFQCHQGFVINTHKIQAYRDKTLVLLGDKEVPVSRAYGNEIKEILTKSLFSKGKN